MNIKKIVPAILALSLLTACGGDAGETVQTGAQTSVSAVQTTASTAASTAASTTAAETTAAASTTAAESTSAETTTAAETSAATTAATSAATTAETTAASGKATGSTAQTGAKSKLDALSERIKNTPNGAVKMVLTENIDTVKVAMVSYTSGKKSRVETDMMGFNLVVVNDGTNTYSLAPDEKVYAKGVSKDNNNGGMENVFDAVNGKNDLKLLKSGTEKFKGKDCDFEEYEGKGNDGEKETFKFYFDKDGNVVGLGFSEKTMQELSQAAKDFSIDFSVTIEEKPDESMFTLPTDYKEITQEEMGMKMLEKVFGGLGDLMQQSGADAGSAAQKPTS